VRASLRLVSTPACRAARAAGHQRFDPIDHVMTYFFTDPSGLEGFLALARALGKAGRKLTLLPPVERGVYEVQSKVAAPRIRVGADVLPWFPIRGVYLLLERGTTPAKNLVDVAGVAGVWSASVMNVDPKLATAQSGQCITYCFLDDDPVATGVRLVSVLATGGVYREWNRFLPHLLRCRAVPVGPLCPVTGGRRRSARPRRILAQLCALA
jgi:hypothetical protein